MKRKCSKNYSELIVQFGPSNKQLTFEAMSSYVGLCLASSSAMLNLIVSTIEVIQSLEPTYSNRRKPSKPYRRPDGEFHLVRSAV